MDWITLFVICMNIIVLQARHDLNIKRLIEIIRRRNSMHHRPILGAPRYPEHLPEAEPILPGHTLIRPAKGMLKSAVKYPLRDLTGSLVYGNEANIGLSYGRNERLRYSDFRKMNNVLKVIVDAIQNSRNKENRPLIFIGKPMMNKDNYPAVVTHTDDENNAREILDKLDPDRTFFEDNYRAMDFRRAKSKSQYRKRSNEVSESETDSESDSGSSEYERNPGNPFTIHKNKYKMNWLWNHFMDGDHMNVNPNAPKFTNDGPSGADLFFGRKWWYFNQDDYKPMG